MKKFWTTVKYTTLLTNFTLVPDIIYQMKDKNKSNNLVVGECIHTLQEVYQPVDGS